MTIKSVSLVKHKASTNCNIQAWYFSFGVLDNMYLWCSFNCWCWTKVYLFCLLQIIESLSVVPAPELALRLYLQCAEVKTFNSILALLKTLHWLSEVGTVLFSRVQTGNTMCGVVLFALAKLEVRMFYPQNETSKNLVWCLERLVSSIFGMVTLFLDVPMLYNDKLMVEGHNV